MQLLEIKNDIAKILYNPADNKLLPSDFLLIEDVNQKLVGQILNIYTTENSNDNIAEVRLALYIDKNEKLSYYNGYIPPKNANVIYITTDEITEMIADSDSNIYLGNLTFHPKSFVKAPMSLVNEKLYIQCDREDNTKMIVQNIVSALYMKQRKVILLDFDGRYSRISNVPRLVISESFKFPLNSDAFNNILEYDTVDCPIEDKAVIQSIVLELRDYIKSIENKFLPFTLFKNVVISEFAANPISGLMVLRNKLWQYAQEGLFAESKADFDIINTVMKNENIVIIDASKIEDKWHKFAIQTIPKILNRHCYFAFSLNDIIMDKRSITALYNNSNIVPIVASSYDYPNRNILKSLSKNQILFKPSKQTEVDEQYGALIHKLNDSDFILFGEASLNLPLIIDLKPFDVKMSESVAEQEIRRNVDKILSTGKSMLPKEAVIMEPQNNNTQISDGSYIVDEDFTDEDLDFIDNIKVKNISIDDLKKTETDKTSDDGYDLFVPLEETVEQLQEADISRNIGQEEYSQGCGTEFDFETTEQIDNEIVESREDVLDTPIEDLIVNESYNENNEVLTDDNNNLDINVLPDIPPSNSKIDYIEETLEQENEYLTESDEECIFLDDIIDVENKKKENPVDEYNIKNTVKLNEDGFLEIEFEDDDENLNSENKNASENLEDEKKNINFEQELKDNVIDAEIISIDDLDKKTTAQETELNNQDIVVQDDIAAADINNSDINDNKEEIEKEQEQTIDDEFFSEELYSEKQSEQTSVTEISDEKISDEAPVNDNNQEFSIDNEFFISEDIIENNEQDNTDTQTANIEEDYEQTCSSEENLLTDENETSASEDTVNTNENNFNTNSEDNSEKESSEIKNQQKKNINTPHKKTKEKLAPIDNIIENIKNQTVQKEKNKSKSKEQQNKIKEKQNKLPQPAQVTNNKTEKKVLTVYETDTYSDVVNENNLPFKVGDRVYHPKHGKGVVEGFANYSNKILFCQIEFENEGRRILDPRISTGLKKID